MDTEVTLVFTANEAKKYEEKIENLPATNTYPLKINQPPNFYPPGTAENCN
jgi:hypothetical protein